MGQAWTTAVDAVAKTWKASGQKLFEDNDDDDDSNDSDDDNNDDKNDDNNDENNDDKNYDKNDVINDNNNDNNNDENNKPTDVSLFSFHSMKTMITSLTRTMMTTIMK